MEKSLTIKDFFERNDVRDKFREMLGKRAPQFITSVLQIAASNDLLRKADPVSIYNAAAVAATLDLPLNNSLGFAYIVPYNVKQPDGGTKVLAQFQLGYKAFIQLAQRSGQFQTISASPVFEGQLIEENPLTGYKFDFTKKKTDIIIGYAAYFRLINGFEKTLYMTKEECKKHGKSYSQTFKFDKGLWKDNFDVMALKTVLKLLLSRYAPLSIESQMQKAIITDKAVINDTTGEDVTYIDNTPEPTEDPEHKRIREMIGDCKTIDDLKKLYKKPGIPDDLQGLWNERLEVINFEIEEQEERTKSGKI